MRERERERKWLVTLNNCHGVSIEKLINEQKRKKKERKKKQEKRNEKNLIKLQGNTKRNIASEWVVIMKCIKF